MLDVRELVHLIIEYVGKFVQLSVLEWFSVQ